MAHTFTHLALVLAALVSAIRGDLLRDLQLGKTVLVGDGIQLRVDRLPDTNQSSYFESHALKILVGDTGLSVAKAKGKAGLNISLFTSRGGSHGDEARGEGNVVGVFLPLMIGFKIAGSILTTLVAVLVVSLKAFLASKVALLLTGSVALKKLWENDHHHPEIHYPMDFYPHGHEMPHDYPSATGYQHSPTPTSYGTSGHESIAAESSVSGQYAGVVTPGNTSAAQPSSIKRRVYKRRNSPIVPILTVHKITRHQTAA